MLLLYNFYHFLHNYGPFDSTFKGHILLIWLSRWVNFITSPNDLCIFVTIHFTGSNFFCTYYLQKQFFYIKFINSTYNWRLLLQGIGISGIKHGKRDCISRLDKPCKYQDTCNCWTRIKCKFKPLMYHVCIIHVCFQFHNNQSIDKKVKLLISYSNWDKKNTHVMYWFVRVINVGWRWHTNHKIYILYIVYVLTP